MTAPGAVAPVEFVPERGRLRLPLEAFDALVAGPGADPGADAALEAAGVTTGGAHHPVVEMLVAPALAPTCVVEVSVAGARGSTGHRVFVSPGGATALLHVSDGLVQVVAARADGVPALVARTVHLGPRPRLGGGDAAPAPQDVSGLTLAEPSTVAAAADRLAASTPWPTFADALRAGTWRLWTARATWPGPDGETGGRALTVLDTPAGMAQVCGLDESGSEGAPDVRLTPATPSSVWLGLVRLLPGDDELPPA